MRLDSRLRGWDPDLTVLVVANLAPVVGVFALDASALGLLLLYWLEFGVLSLWAVVRAMFAGRPVDRSTEPLLLGALAEKRASLSVPGSDVAVRLMTVPTLLVVVPVLVGGWVLVGALAVGPVAAANPGAETPVWVVVGALGLFLTEGGRTLVGYVYRGGYRDHNVVTALRGVVTEGATVLLAGGLALFVAFLAAGGPDGSVSRVERAAGGPLVVAVVSVKLAADLAEYYHGGRGGVGGWLRSALGADDGVYRPPERESVDTGLSAPSTTIRPPRAGRLLATVRQFRAHPWVWLVGPVAVLAAGVAAAGGARRVALAALVVGIAGPVLLVQSDYWLRYAGVEYRTDGVAVVAVDRLFQTGLWRLDATSGADVRIERDPVDEWLGTATVTVVSDDRTVQLPRLPDTTPVVDALASTPPEDRAPVSVRARVGDGLAGAVETARALVRPGAGPDRTVVAVGLALSLLAAAVPVGLFVAAPQVGSGAVAAAVVVSLCTAPFVALILLEIVT